MATSNYHWLLSFSRAEQVLMSNIDEDGGCRRKCYRVVRQLKEDVWCPGSKPVITAFHLQVPDFLCFIYISSHAHKSMSGYKKISSFNFPFPLYSTYFSRHFCFGHVRSTPAPGTGGISGHVYCGWCTSSINVLASTISGITSYDPTTF